MARWRSPELEAILRVPLDEQMLSETIITDLVAHGASEGEQLDFKRECYPASRGVRGDWTEEQEFAKDVAAFANHRGGMVVIGIAETDGLATSTTPMIGLNPAAEEQRLRAALANFLVPMAETMFIGVSASSGGGHLCVIIPPSRRAPHAVLSRPGDARRPLHYPIRHGADINWMTSFEVAERYRRQFADLADENVRLERLVAIGHAALRRADGIWLWLATLPESPVESTLDGTSVQTINTWYHQIY